MKLASPKLINSPEKSSVKKINISLPPEIEHSHRIAQLPKLSISKRSKILVKRLKEASHALEFYSIAYIGENSGELTISSRKSAIPRITHEEILKESRRRHISRGILVKSPTQEKPHEYYKPKPLTPASIKLHDFSEYRHKLTVTPNFCKYSSRRIKNSFI